MKKKYKFGEILLILREEYKECKHILEEMNKCVSVDTSVDKYYFSGVLAHECNSEVKHENKIRLYVEKRYSEILKKIQYLKYDWYNQYLYSAYYNVVKKENDSCDLIYDEILTPVDGRKYIPKVEIIDEDKFSLLVDELLETDLMQLKAGYFKVNHDTISLGFDTAYISTPLGDDSTIYWNGINDELQYSVTRHQSPYLLEEILSLEISAEEIAPSWLELLNKHEDHHDLAFDVDINVQSNKGILQITDTDHKDIVMLAKKPIIK